jgi:hypothetical protein
VGLSYYVLTIINRSQHMATKLIQTQWGVFSSNFVKFHRLPFGTELRLYDYNGRKKRTDFLVKRQRISAKVMNRADDVDNVRSLLDTAMSMLSTNLKARRLRLELFSPNGELINGNKLVRTVRQMTPLPTADDIERKESEEASISEVQSTARASIIESEYLVDDPSTTVCVGYIRALIERYGRSAILSALEH